MAEEANSLEFTPTWVVAIVCFVIVLASLLAERGLHKLGKVLKRKDQHALFQALQKLKEELMLLGFISLLLTVTQNAISRICMPAYLAITMLPCKRPSKEHGTTEQYFHHHVITNQRRLLSESSDVGHCIREGKVQMFSQEGLHQLHIFIFVLAVVHVIFCATTAVLGGARIREWKAWEDSIRTKGTTDTPGNVPNTIKPTQSHQHHLWFLYRHAYGYWRKAAVVSWLRGFFKQFHGSITKSDYIALRKGFITAHCPSLGNKFDFHKYMVRTLEIDFKKVVVIRWYLWLFVVLFLLLNVRGWHTYFWLAFLPLILLLLVGAKLEHIITRLAMEAEEMQVNENLEAQVKPSDEHFWFRCPALVLHLIHFILFQNSFEIAFFFWILCTYGFRSCIMERLAYIIPRLIMGVIVQVLCSYSTLPLYALVSQMGSRFKKGMFGDSVESMLSDWLGETRERREAQESAQEESTSMNQLMAPQPAPVYEHQQEEEQEMVVIDYHSNS